MGGLRFWPIRILVAGGCGFIGSNYVCHVVREHPGVHVVVPDKLTYAGNPRNIADLPADRVQLVVGDTCDVPLANRLVAESDAVVNLAAESLSNKSILDPLHSSRPTSRAHASLSRDIAATACGSIGRPPTKSLATCSSMGGVPCRPS